ncbi:MAG: rRNA-processing protein RimM [Bacillales bacterium]|jgi:16S rRNA processing protein RimM|nr:rRNA-processing protein RimM [Bacillales bacterium]
MDWYNVGKIVNTHGIRGEVRVLSITDFPEERFVKGEKVAAFMPGKKEPVTFTIKSVRPHKQFYLLTFEGYEDINLVEKFKGAELKISEDQLFELDEDEFYYHEIIGCEVFNEKETLIGTITEILTPGANDVWVVRTPNKKEVLIPYIESVVKIINIDEKKIVIEEMEGLFD